MDGKAVPYSGWGSGKQERWGMDKRVYPVGVIQMVSSDLIKQEYKKEDLS
ncbi:hypothetical protein [Lacrimispora brassicae]